MIDVSMRDIAVGYVKMHIFMGRVRMAVTMHAIAVPIDMISKVITSTVTV